MSSPWKGNDPKQEIKITPLFSDSDALGHANYQAIIRYLEEARSPLYRLLFPDYLESRSFLVLAHLELDFSHETLIDRELTIQSAVTKIGNSSFTMQQKLIQDGNLNVQCLSVFVHFDRQTRKAIPLNKDLMKTLQDWSTPASS